MSDNNYQTYIADELNSIWSSMLKFKLAQKSHDRDIDEKLRDDLRDLQYTTENLIGEMRAEKSRGLAVPGDNPVSLRHDIRQTLGEIIRCSGDLIEDIVWQKRDDLDEVHMPVMARWSELMRKAENLARVLRLNAVECTEMVEARDMASSAKQQQHTPENRDASENDEQQAPAIGKAGITWQDAMKLAEKHVRAHGGAFPSVKRLAEIVGCSRPTMDKAIDKSSFLRAKKAEAQNRKSVRTVALSDPAIEEASEAQYDANELANLIDEQKIDMAQEERQAQAARKRRS